MDKQPYIVGVGAANADLNGASLAPIHLRDSNPGHISLSAGGVTRNVCENLARLGADVKLLSCVGDDTFGAFIRRSCEDAGIDASHLYAARGASSSMYLSILDADGDMLVGIASSGVHSNGFSLVRKVFEMTKESLDTYYVELGTTLGEALIAPTKIYVKTLKAIKDAGVTVKGCSHITGGGFYENIPRMLPEGVRAVVEKDSYPVLPIFKLLQKTGNIAEKMMYNTFNMGLGMVLAIDPADKDKVLSAIEAAGEKGYVVGKVIAGETGVVLC